jgi:hypothetical protein
VLALLGNGSALSKTENMNIGAMHLKDGEALIENKTKRKYDVRIELASH